MPTETRHRVRIGGSTLALILAVSLWGTSFVAMKVAVGVLPPLAVVFLRMVAAGLLVAPVCQQFLPRRIAPTHWPILLFMALCEPGLYFLLEGYALTLTTASQAGMVAAVMPLLTVVGASFALAEPITPRLTLGLALSIAGVVTLSLGGAPSREAPNPALGNALEFLAMAVGAGYAVSARYLAGWYSPWFLTAFQAWAGAVMFLPGAYLLTGVAVAQLPVTLWVAVLYLGSFVTLGAYGLFNWGLSRVPAGQASLFINLIPVVALLSGWLLLDDRLTSVQIAGCMTVLVGVVIGQSRRGQRSTRPES